MRLLLLLFLTAPLWAQNTDIDSFFANEKKAKELRREANQLAGKAHEHLDAGRYKEAGTTHRQSKNQLAHVERLEGEAKKRLGTVTSNLIQQLTAPRFEEWKRATQLLTALGVRALPFIQKPCSSMGGQGSDEERSRHIRHRSAGTEPLSHPAHPHHAQHRPRSKLQRDRRRPPYRNA